MKRRVWFLILVIGLLALAVPVALAQTGEGDKVVFNEAFTLKAGESLYGNLAVVGGSVTLEQNSIVRGDVVLFGGELIVEGAITGQVASFGGRVTLGNSAVVEGDFAALGGSVDQAAGATIRGETLLGLPSLNLDKLGIRKPGMDVSPPLAGPKEFLKEFFFWQLRTFGTALVLVILGIAALLVAPKGMGRIASTAAAQPALSFGMGLLTFLVALFTGTLLLIACGLGLLVWLALAIAQLLGWIGVGLWIGQRLLAALNVRTASSLAEVIVGIFLITVLAELPFCIGFFVWLILGAIGLGAVVLTRFGTQSPEGGAPANSVALVPVETDEGRVVPAVASAEETVAPVVTTDAPSAVQPGDVDLT